MLTLVARPTLPISTFWRVPPAKNSRLRPLVYIELGGFTVRVATALVTEMVS